MNRRLKAALRSPEARIAWIVLWMLLAFTGIFILLARVPASSFNWLFR